MKERPILFSAPMVRALLDGSKTQTRRIFQPDHMTWDANGRYTTHAMRDGELITTGSGPFNPSSWLHYCPYGQPGDRLWVRETFYCDHSFYPNGVGVDCIWREIDGKREPIPIEDQRKEMLESMYYRADGEPEWEGAESPTTWRPSIHMPRWVSRIMLEITGVRVERLQDISEADVMTEGWPVHKPSDPRGYTSPKQWYAVLWQQINGPGSWKANPWVWVVEFKVVKP